MSASHLNCREGSLENSQNEKTGNISLNCREGSLEKPVAWAVI